MKEIWKFVDGYGGMYEVSNFGRVRSYHRSARAPMIPHVLSPGKTVSGYRFIVMCDGKGIRRNQFVHTLVATHFIGGRPVSGKPLTINHKDHDKANNHVSNLEWLSHTDNIRHSSKVIHRNRGEANRSKLTEYQVREMRRRWDAREATATSLGKEFGVSATTAWMIVRRKKWKHIV